MSLKTFLAAGQSFLGMNREKSRYKVSTEMAPPNFAAQDAHIRQRELKAREPDADTQAGGSPEAASAAGEAAPEPAMKQPKRFFRWRNLFSSKTKEERRLVQAELRLGKVEPLRNDLNDSDLMVVTKPKAEAVKKRLWLAQSLLEHNRKDFSRAGSSEAEGEQASPPAGAPGQRKSAATLDN
jgi:hypothetical protein